MNNVLYLACVLTAAVSTWIWIACIRLRKPLIFSIFQFVKCSCIQMIFLYRWNISSGFWIVRCPWRRRNSFSSTTKSSCMRAYPKKLFQKCHSGQNCLQTWFFLREREQSYFKQTLRFFFLLMCTEMRFNARRTA